MKVNTIPVKIISVFFVVCILFFLVARQMYTIQVVRHDELLGKARERYHTTEIKHKRRGKIFDYNGNLLVGNNYVKTIAFDPREEVKPERREQIARLIADEIGDSMNITFQEILDRLNSGVSEKIDEETGDVIKKLRGYVVILRDVEYTKGEEIQKKIKERRLKGLIFENSVRLTYPKNSMMANILGYGNNNGNDVETVAGLLKNYGNDMKPVNETVSYDRSRDGKRISYGDDTQIDGKMGKNIYLTIHEPIQAILEEELDRMYQETQAEAVYAVVADPNTGDILAMAQRPTFNPNDRSQMRGEAYRSRVGTDMYEPGSVMKPFVVAMALDRNVITENALIDTGFGPWKFAGRPLRDTHYIGTATPLEIIQNSSNIGTAMIAVEMGQEALYNALKAFHFGEKTNVLTEESAGRLPPLSKWYKISVSRICIGHGVMVTPLQLTRAYCMLANGGYDVGLRLIDSIETDEEGRKKMPYYRSAQSVFKNPMTHSKIVKMLKTVTKPGGTAKEADVPGFNVAGKTGTANLVENGVYVKKYNASFCGFIPADKPKFVVVLTCSAPKGEKQFGGTVSGPVFSRFASRTLKFWDIHPEMTPEEWDADRKKSLKEALRVRSASGWEAERQSRLKAGKTLEPTGIIRR